MSPAPLHASVPCSAERTVYRLARSDPRNEAENSGPAESEAADREPLVEVVSTPPDGPLR